ncbi:MAG: hypothetical protein ACJ77E_12355 [Gaiellaceae bacterium]
MTIGALACSAPDVEHLIPMRRNGAKLFHGKGWHRSGGLSVGKQVLLSSAVLGAVLVPRA